MQTSVLRPALLALPCVLALWAGNASAALVNLSLARVEVTLVGPGLLDTVPLEIPTFKAALLSSNFGVTSTLASHFVVDDVTTLMYGSSYIRQAGSGTTVVNQSSAFLNFTVDQMATYDLSGVMAVSDPISGAGPTYGTSLFSASLIDITGVPTGLLTSSQSSTSVEDAAFVFGDFGLTGSLTGTLQAGRTYEFQYRSRIESPLNLPYGFMNASSTVRLNITAVPTEPPPVGAVPEPGTLALLLAAALGYGATRRR